MRSGFAKMTVAALAFATLAGAAFAQNAVLICTLKTTPKSFTTSPLVIGLNLGDGLAGVYDPLIAAIKEEPLVAKRSQQGGKVVIDWEVTNFRDSQGAKIGNLVFRAKYAPETGRISVRSYVKGYDNAVIVTYGSCEEKIPEAKPRGRKKS